MEYNEIKSLKMPKGRIAVKTIFIVNPKAGGESVEKKIKEAIDKLPMKEQCGVYVTKGVGDATLFVNETCNNESGELRFIACGGDGTINEVFSGAVGKENVSVSCFPCGSGNDFVKCFGGAEAFSDIEKLVTAEARPIDVLKVGDRYSINVTNFGFDTTVAITINAEREKTGHGNKNAYTKGVVKALLTAMKNRAKVWADGELLNPDGELLLCTAANGQYVGGSFKCAPRAELDDGFMEVCLAKCISRLRFVKLLTPYTNGEHLDREEFSDIIVYRRAKKIEVEAPEGFAYSLDGEIIYENRFTVEILPKALNFAH